MDFLTAITTDIIPTRYSEALPIPHWRNAVYSEITELERNQTWDLTSLPPKALGCKWVYKMKRKSDGSIERYKACLVILDNTQVEGLDYN